MLDPNAPAPPVRPTRVPSRANQAEQDMGGPTPAQPGTDANLPEAPAGEATQQPKPARRWGDKMNIEREDAPLDE